MQVIIILGRVLLIALFSVCLYAQGRVELQLSKTKAYVGEPLLATVVFSYQKGDGVLKTEFEEFMAKNFWIEKNHTVEKKHEGDTIYERYKFVISPQKYGTLSVPKQLFKASYRNLQTNRVNWREYYTNSALLEVLPLPKGAMAAGHFELKAKVDREKVEQNRPVNLTITLKGYGDFEDIVPFHLKLPGQTVFTANPKIKTDFKKSHNFGQLQQKISIVSDQEFTIPSLTLRYFDLKTKEMRIVKTKPIKIEVINNGPKKLADYWYLLFLLGIMLGVAISWVFIIYKRYQQQKIQNSVLKERIKKAKNDNELYRVLLPYCNDERLNLYIKRLEENIFMDKSHKIEKKTILKSLSKAGV